MRRRHTIQEEALLRRWKKEWDQYTGYLWGERVDRPVSRKRHPLDCGNSRCGTCHQEKRFGHQKTRQEKKSDLYLREIDP